MVIFPVAKRKLTGTLGERIRVLLDEQGKTAAWLAGVVNLHRVSVSRIINGHVTDLTISTVRALAVALGVSVGDLLDDAD